MRALNFRRAVLAGIAGTAVMTLMTVMAGAMGMEMDIPGMLSGFMGTPVVVGWIAHFMIGTILALIYAAAFAAWLPGAPWLRGAVYGVFPFLLAQLAVMPVMGMGVFTSGAPNALMMVGGSFMGHLVYGAIVGALYRPAGGVPVMGRAPRVAA
jgi:uncharacterized membrane protein YagU involved in acid resistance